MNLYYVSESIHKGAILDSRKEIPIKNILTENEVRRAESGNESFKEMWRIKIENHMKRDNKLKEKSKKAYVMIFKEFCPCHTQNIIKENPKYDSIINNNLKLMDAISQSMH